MRIFKPEELFDIAEANLQRPAQREGFDDFRRLQGEVGGEETIVTTVAAGIADYNDAQQPRSGARPTLGPRFIMNAMECWMIIEEGLRNHRPAADPACRRPR